MKKLSTMVVLIITNKTHRDGILRSLVELQIDAIAFDTVEEALEEVEFIIADYWLICFSTDGISETKSHNRDYILEKTQKLRDRLGEPPLFVLDDCDKPLKELAPITMVNSHFNAPIIIKEFWNRDE